MISDIDKLRNFIDLLAGHGRQFVIGMLFLIGGFLLSKWLANTLKANLDKLSKNVTVVSMIVNTVRVVLYGFVIAVSAIEIGADPRRVVVILTFVCLASIAIVIIFRPLLPTLPFKVGNTVKIGNLLGKIETTSILNTRVRTFDGKTFFVPNRQILDDIVINYHFTQTRRVKINATIRYDQDLLKAKQVLESVMIKDPRVLAKPSPVIYVLNLGPNGVELGARCWVDNKKFWFTKCDLTEKIKFAFDLNDIEFAYTQLDLHNYDGDKAFKNDNPTLG